MKVRNGKYGNAARCGKCGGRLFLESEHLGKKARPYWECSVGCGQRYEELRGGHDYPVGILPILQDKRQTKHEAVGLVNR